MLIWISANDSGRWFHKGKTYIGSAQAHNCILGVIVHKHVVEVAFALMRTGATYIPESLLRIKRNFIKRESEDWTI